MHQSAFIISAFDVRIPKIIYGTAWKGERTAGLVEHAVSLGFRGVDTACQPKHYHEAGVGEGLAASFKTGLARSDIYLQTKFTPVNGQDPKRMPYDPKADLALQVSQSFETSLLNLKTDYLDGLILHSPYSQEQQTMEVWRAMEAIFNHSGTRQLGISNCHSLEVLQSLYQYAKVKPAILQNRFYANTHYDREIREYCKQQHILYQSFWILSANPHILAHPTMMGLAVKYGRTPEQIFFHYLTEIGVIPLTGTTQQSHMVDDLAIFDFTLTETECMAVASLLT